MTLRFPMSGDARSAEHRCRSGRGAGAKPVGATCVAAHRAFPAGRLDEDVRR